MISKKTLLFLAILFIESPAFAKIHAVATTNDIAWILYRIAGEDIDVKVLAKPGDNYHFIDARPDYILSVSRSDILCKIGAELEIGWLPKVIDRAANIKVMSGGSGDCDLSRAVNILEKPTSKVDRSMGDVHASGNPHFWLSPIEMAASSKEVLEKLISIDPTKTAIFKKNRENLVADLIKFHKKMKDEIKDFSSRKVIEYHKNFVYFLNAYGFSSIGSIEEISGVSPSAARLGKIALEAKKNEVQFAFATDHDPKNILKRFSELSGIPVHIFPVSLFDPKDPMAYQKWQESIFSKIMKAK